MAAPVEETRQKGQLAQLMAPLNSFNAFQNVCWSNRGDPVAFRALERLQQPMATVMGTAVCEIIQEMKANLHDPQLQTSGLHILRSVVRDNEYAKQLILGHGGVQVIVQGMQQHPNNERLLTEALEAADELHGLASLVEALEHLKPSAPGVRATLWALSSASKNRWSEITALPAKILIETLLGVVDTHKDDFRILLGGLEFMSDLTLDSPALRAPFAAAGGWEWLLTVLESRHDQCHVLLQGFKIMSSLACGGAWAEAYAMRCTAILERALCQHAEQECLVYWALWAIQRLNGAAALILPLSSGKVTTPSTALSVLHCLNGVALGQSDAASVSDMPALIDAVVYVLQKFKDHNEVIYEGIVVLGHATAFVVGANAFDLEARHSAEQRQRLVACTQTAVAALLHLIQLRLADADTVKATCESLAQIIEASGPDSPLRISICRALFRREDGSNDVGQLLSRVMAAHVSNDTLQTTLMWLTGIAHGVGPVVEQMRLHPSSFAIQMSGIRTLGLLYGDRIDLEQDVLQALAGAFGAVTSAMAAFKHNIVLQQHACYALGVMAEQSSESKGAVGEDVLLQSIAAAVEALNLIRGRCDGMETPSSYNALYLRKESTRCIVSICGVWPALGRWLRERAMQDVLADALKTTAESVWDGNRDKEAEETLRLELLALSYVLGPPTAILEPLRCWGRSKPALARAAADAVVELARGAHRSGAAGLDTSDPISAAVALPVQSLQAACAAAQFMGVLEAHAADEDLIARVNLALGFLTSAA